jgi:hypothetical protein
MHRVAAAISAACFASSAAAAEGAWVAFFREGNNSAAFERASLSANTVNVLSVSPKKTTGTLVYAWEIKTQIHRFDCAANKYRMLNRKLFDEKGTLTGDETAVVTAMNDAFKDRWHPVDTEALRKAFALVCAKNEPQPAKPFNSFNEAIGWMAN